MEVPSHVLVTFGIIIAVALIVGVAYNQLGGMTRLVQNKTIELVFFRVQSAVYDAVAEASRTQGNCSRRIFLTSEIQIRIEPSHQFGSGNLGPAIEIQGYSIERIFKLPTQPFGSVMIEYQPSFARGEIIVIDVRFRPREPELFEVYIHNP